MTLQRISTILRAGALAALFVVGTSAAANADTFVVFNTSGDFGGGSNFVVFGPDALGGDSATLTYTPNAAGLVFVPTGSTINSNFGELELDFTSGGGVLFTGAINQPFSLTINQFNPSIGSDVFLGTVTGNVVGANTSDLELIWTTPSITIGDVTYRLDNVSINNPGNQGGITTVQGDISVSAIPEPTTMMLLGTGLLAAFRARRKAA